MFHKQWLVLQTEGILLLLFKIKCSSFIHYISAAASHPPHLPAPPSTPSACIPSISTARPFPFIKEEASGLSTEYDITSYITTRHIPSYQVWARQPIEGKGSQKKVKSHRHPAPTLRSPTKHQANDCNIWWVSSLGPCGLLKLPFQTLWAPMSPA